MPFKRQAEPTSIEQERDALRAQHAALEDLKHQLAERIDAVREREVELHHALTAAEAGTVDPSVAALLPRHSPSSAADADTGEDALEAARPEKELAERERALAAREAALEARAREVALAGEQAAASADPDATRLAHIETRLAELRDAEKLFLRTRDELAARSEAVAARERLVSQREREIDARDDALDDGTASHGISEMEERLRRLEQQQKPQPGEQTLGFAGGIRRLEHGTRTPRPG